MNSTGRLVGSPSRESIELFYETRLVRITHGGFAIWLDPFGMLDPQVVVNLLPEFGVGVDLVSHRHCLGERIQVCRGTVPPKPRRNSRPTVAPWSARQQFQKTARTCSWRVRRRAESITFRRWRCSNTASSPLCVRVAGEIIT